METKFTNSRNSKTFDPRRLLLNLKKDLKIDLKKVINMLLYQILAFNIHGKFLKGYTKTKIQNIRSNKQ